MDDAEHAVEEHVDLLGGERLEEGGPPREQPARVLARHHHRDGGRGRGLPSSEQQQTERAAPPRARRRCAVCSWPPVPWRVTAEEGNELEGDAPANKSN